MDNKLQALTEKLYGEGLEKGRAEGERLVEEAKKRASQIVADAEGRAAAIVEDARTKAADIEKNTMTEITLAGKQAVAKIKGEIADAIVSKGTTAAVGSAGLDAAFIKEMLVEVARNWNGSEDKKVSLQALLPEAHKAKLDAAFTKCAQELLAEGIEVGWSKEVKSGFRVGEKNGGYYISFSDESFDALLKSYLREKVYKMLYQA